MARAPSAPVHGPLSLPIPHASSPGRSRWAPQAGCGWLWPLVSRDPPRTEPTDTCAPSNHELPPCFSLALALRPVLVLCVLMSLPTAPSMGPGISAPGPLWDHPRVRKTPATAGSRMFPVHPPNGRSRWFPGDQAAATSPLPGQPQLCLFLTPPTPPTAPWPPPS